MSELPTSKSTDEHDKTRLAVLEKQLRDSNERFSQVFESTPKALLLAKAESGHIVQVNDRFRKFFLAPDSFKFVGKVYTELAPWKNDAKRLREKLSSDGHVYNCQFELPLDGERTRSAHYSAEVLNFGSHSLVLVSIDEPNQPKGKGKGKGKEILPADAAMKLMLEQLPAVLWTTDKDLRFMSSSGAGLKGLKLKPDEVVGKSLEEFLGDAGDIPIAAARKSLQGESTRYTSEVQGQIYQCCLEPLRNAHGDIIGTIGVGQDVTEITRSKLELEASQQRWQTVMQHAPVYVTLLDEEARIQYINRPRDSDEEILGKVVYNYLDPQHRQATAGSVERVFATGEPDNHTVQATDQRWYFSQLAPVFGSDQKVTSVVSINTDITDQKSQEEELRAAHEQLHAAHEQLRLANDELEKRVDERTEALRHDIAKRLEVEQTLREERKLLQQLLDVNQRDRRLISYEIHDGIVQHMTASLLFMQSTAAGLEDGVDVSETLTTGTKLLQGSIDEARRLINDLRPATLEEEGVIPAVLNLVDECEQRSDAKIKFHHDVRFNRLAPALEMAIFRIIQESLNNALQHSKSSIVEVSLIQPKREVKILVEDWGVGFDITRVRKKRYGLEGVRERAMLLGGEAEIESTPGKGTCVSVRLPVKDLLLPDTDQPGDESDPGRA